MNVFIIILTALMVVLVMAALVLIFKKDAPAKGEMQNLPANAAVVSVKKVATSSGMRNQLTVLVDDGVFTENTVVPFNFELEGVLADDPDDELERFRNPDTPEEERIAIAESLRKNGYRVNYPPEGMKRTGSSGNSGNSGGSRNDEGREDDDDEDDDREERVPISEETDRAVLKDILMNPYSSVSDQEAARLRLDELSLQDDGADPVPNPMPEVPDYGQDDSYYGGEMVDPDTYEPLGPSAPEYQPEGDGGGYGREEPVREARVEPVTVSRKEPAQSNRAFLVPVHHRVVDLGKPIEFTMDEMFHDAYDDSKDSMDAIILMGFIAKSFKDHLIEPELVEFAQRKLHLYVNPGYWTEEDHQRANARVAIYERTPVFSDMVLEDFDKYVRAAVAAESAKRAGEEAAREAEALEAAREDEAPAPEPEVGEGVEPEGSDERVVDDADGTVDESADESADAGEAAEGADAEVPPADPGGAQPRTEDTPEPEPVDEPEPEVRTTRSGITYKPKKRSDRPVSAFFDANGGRNDLMWPRLERE